MVRRVTAALGVHQGLASRAPLHDAETVYAGVEDAALFKSTDGGTAWKELSGLRQHDTGPQWQPGAGGMCLHTVLQHRSDFGFPIAVHAHEPETIYVVPITSDSHHFPPEGKLRVSAAAAAATSGRR